MSNLKTVFKNFPIFVEYWFISSKGNIIHDYDEMTEINQLTTIDNYDDIRYLKKSAQIIILNNVAVAINER